MGFSVSSYREREMSRRCKLQYFALHPAGQEKTGYLSELWRDILNIHADSIFSKFNAGSACPLYGILRRKNGATVGVGIDDNGFCPFNNIFIDAECITGLRSKRHIRTCRLSQSQYQTFAASAAVIVVFNAQRLLFCCGKKFFKHIFCHIR